MHAGTRDFGLGLLQVSVHVSRSSRDGSVIRCAPSPVRNADWYRVAYPTPLALMAAPQHLGGGREVPWCAGDVGPRTRPAHPSPHDVLPVVAVSLDDHLKTGHQCGSVPTQVVFPARSASEPGPIVRAPATRSMRINLGGGSMGVPQDVLACDEQARREASRRSLRDTPRFERNILCWRAQSHPTEIIRQGV
jgi:hypothetical protein